VLAQVLPCIDVVAVVEKQEKEEREEGRHGVCLTSSFRFDSRLCDVFSKIKIYQFFLGVR
jgi:hypothetical protein